MKKFFILLLLVVSTGAFGQFKLSGKINLYAGSSQIAVNIPVVYGFFEQNSVTVPVAKNGTFNVTIPVKSQKFATLSYQGSAHLLLLNADKNLNIELDASGKNIKILSGSALPENSLIDKIKLTEFPAFLQDDRYTRMDKNALISQLLTPYLAARDRKIAQIRASGINSADKKLIAAETRYIAYNYLHELTDIGAENPATLNKFVADIYGKADVKPEVMPAGPQYYTFVNNYLQELEKRTPGKPTSLLLRWESAVKYLPENVSEEFGYQLILRAFYNGDATQLKALASAYLNKFPAGAYGADAKKKAASVK